MRGMQGENAVLALSADKGNHVACTHRDRQMEHQENSLCGAQQQRQHACSSGPDGGTCHHSPGVRIWAQAHGPQAIKQAHGLLQGAGRRTGIQCMVIRQQLGAKL